VEFFPIETQNIDWDSTEEAWGGKKKGRCQRPNKVESGRERCPTMGIPNWERETRKGEPETPESGEENSSATVPPPLHDQEELMGRGAKGGEREHTGGWGKDRSAVCKLRNMSRSIKATKSPKKQGTRPFTVGTKAGSSRAGRSESK